MNKCWLSPCWVLTSQLVLASFHKALRSYFGTGADLYALTRTQILEENSPLL